MNCLNTHSCIFIDFISRMTGFVYYFILIINIFLQTCGISMLKIIVHRAVYNLFLCRYSPQNQRRLHFACKLFSFGVEVCKLPFVNI